MKATKVNQSTSWKIATLVESKLLGPMVRSLIFNVEDWTEFTPGQHFDLRLTAPDGYQAQRAYSIASSPLDKGRVEFGVDILPKGEVSSYLDQMEVGEQIELKGPLGGHFVWDGSSNKPLILIGAGSGLVPLMSMIRYANDISWKVAITLLLSDRTWNDLMWRDELLKVNEMNENVDVHFTLTREQPADWKGFSRRIDVEMLNELFDKHPKSGTDVYICGPTAYVEKAADLMVEIGFDAANIRTERFGPTD